jgi:hypothetical protein
MALALVWSKSTTAAVGRSISVFDRILYHVVSVCRRGVGHALLSGPIRHRLDGRENMSAKRTLQSRPESERTSRATRFSEQRSPQYIVHMLLIVLAIVCMGATAFAASAPGIAAFPVQCR